MAIKSNFPERLQVRLTSSVELIRASLEPYISWIEAIDLQVSGDHELKTASGAAPGFIRTHLSRPDSSSSGGSSRRSPTADTGLFGIRLGTNPEFHKFEHMITEVLMQIRNNQGELIGEINTTFTDKGEKIVTNTMYNNGRPVAQNISVRDNEGKVRTTNIIGGKILP